MLFDINIYDETDMYLITLSMTTIHGATDNRCWLNGLCFSKWDISNSNCNTHKNCEFQTLFFFLSKFNIELLCKDFSSLIRINYNLDICKYVPFYLTALTVIRPQ